MEQDLDRIAKLIREELVPSVAAAFPWEKMESGKDGYKRAALAVMAYVAGTKIREQNKVVPFPGSLTKP